VFLLRILNLILLVSLVGCLAGAMAGLIVFAPFVGGAWFLTLISIAGFEGSPPKPAPKARFDSQRATEPGPVADTRLRSAPADSRVG